MPEAQFKPEWYSFEPEAVVSVDDVVRDFPVLDVQVFGGSRFYLVDFTGPSSVSSSIAYARALDLIPHPHDFEVMVEIEPGHLAPVGGMDFGQSSSDVVRVTNARILGRFRGIGVGRWLYRTSINRLVERGYTVESDFKHARSPMAERMWRAILEHNPQTVRVIPSASGPNPDRYVVKGYIRRRP